MNRPISSVPDNTLDTLARNFCREAKSYGFGRIDYLRYINFLLEHSSDDLAMDTVRVGATDTAAPAPLEPTPLPVAGERLSVRAFGEDGDKALFKEWLTDEYGRYFLLSRTSGRRTDFDALLQNPKHILGVIESDAGRPIGAVAYLNHDPVRRKAELRKLIGDPDYRRRGLAREATELWIRYGLSVLGLRKIYVNTLHTNFRNIKLNESLGFKVEGLLHNEALIDGKYQDVLRMGLWHESASDDDLS